MFRPRAAATRHRGLHRVLPVGLSTGGSGPRPRARAAFAHRPFRLLWAARTVSMFGNAVAPIALAFAVLELGGTAAQLGLILAARAVPQLVFLLVGGVVADRLPRQRVMVAADVGAGLTQVAAGALFVAGSLSLWQLAVLEGVGGAASAFFLPASFALVPQTVPRDLLQGANALLRLAINGTTILGGAAAGLLVATAGPGWALGVDGATYLVSAVIVLRLRVAPVAGGLTDGALAQLREGWQAFASRPWLWIVVVQFSIVNAAHAGAFQVLGPVIADDRLGGAGAWGVIVAAEAVGFVLGGLLALRLPLQRPLAVGVATSGLVALPVVLLGVGASVVVIVAGALAAGVGVEIFGVAWDLSLQGHIPNDQLSRVNSYDALGSFALIPVGTALTGVVAAATDAQATCLLAAGLMVVATVAALATRAVRALPRPG